MRFWLGKLIGFLVGLLLGIALILVPVVLHTINNPSIWANYARKAGAVNSIIYHCLWAIPVAFLVGLFFGIIGQAWGGRLQEAANQRSAQRMAVAVQAQQAGNVWPPPPDRGNTDDT